MEIYSNWDVSNVTNMKDMFAYSSFKEIYQDGIYNFVFNGNLSN